jgi:diguanylate cyclase (GGDEF)-like protein
VIGYVNANLSSTVLWSMTLPSIAVSAGIGLIIVLLFWLIARISTRRITAPLGMLAKVADDIAAGKQSEPLRIEGSGEVRHIASVFNGIISGLHEHRQQMATDRKILNLKVDERTEQLTQHKEELDKAVQKVNETQSRIRHLSYFDTLTSLPNRRLFTEQLTLLLRLAHRNKQKVGLLVIDIDYFKRINDSLGAAGGDQLLREVSERMAGCVRDSDVLHRHANQESSVMDLSRMGGDEFTVVLNQVVDVEAAMGVAGRLAAAIARPYHIENQEVVISSSIGVAIAPEHGKDVESLLRAADLAMITAKKRGRNRILSFEPNMQGDDRERLRMENDLRKAEQRQQLLLHYQPQVHARSGEVRGVETLVRWSHPDKGLIPPFKWIPMAEELGLIDEIGNWVLRESCRTLRELQEEGFALPKMSVNVSALQFHDRFVHSVESALHESGIDAGCLSLEFTEGVMINDEETTVGLVQQLKDLGVRLSIDDFGTGYSSLSYLARFPLDEIKIDRSFVLGLARGQQNAELVRAIIAMARNLELEIVVEGVERLEELRFFREQEAHVIQGFLFSPPVSLDALRKQLAPSHFEKQLRLLDQQMSIDSMGLEKA